MTDLFTILRVIQDAYRAGAGLPAMKKHRVCPRCREVYEADLTHECPIEDTSDWPDDEKLDSPTHTPYSHRGKS